LETTTDPTIRRDAPGPDSTDTIMVELTRAGESLEEPEYSTMIVYDNNALMQETVELLPGEYNISITLFSHQNVIIPEEHNTICEGACCYRIPNSGTCGPRGQTEEDYEAGDCYIEGYHCGTGAEALVEDAVDPSLGTVACAVSGLRVCLGEEGLEITGGEGIPFDLPEINLTFFPNGGAIYNGWNIGSYGYLDSGDNITLYLFRQKVPTRQHHFFREGDIYINYSNDYPYMVMPEIR